MWKSEISTLELFSLNNIFNKYITSEQNVVEYVRHWRVTDNSWEYSIKMKIGDIYTIVSILTYILNLKVILLKGEVVADFYVKC